MNSPPNAPQRSLLAGGVRADPPPVIQAGMHAEAEAGGDWFAGQALPQQGEKCAFTGGKAGLATRRHHLERRGEVRGETVAFGG